MNSSPASPFVIKEAPIENQRRIKVRVIGAGYSGIYLGIRIPQRIQNVDLKIYEKNEDVGGTWWENRYPGCACDIPSYSYQYSFEPNPDWSSVYAPADEICRYLHNVAAKYNLSRYVRLNHKVERCQWDDETKKWMLTIRNLQTRDMFQDSTDVLISARGNLNEPSWPSIPGLDGFQGEVMHSARWNQEFENKTVGVIGSGSSAIQIVPALQKINGVRLKTFVRSRTWIANPLGENSMRKLGLDPLQLKITDDQRQHFRDDPQAYLGVRRAIERDSNNVHSITIRDSPLSKEIFNHLSTSMRERLFKKPEIARHLIPSFSVSCRRLTPGPGYLEALVSDNVDFIPETISRITPGGLELMSGEKIDLDVLVCATGFNTAAPPPFAVIGKGGISLDTKFEPFPQTYVAIAVDSFPNFFTMLGPNSAIGSGSLTIILEAQGDYIVKCIRKLQKEDYASMQPKPERVADFTEFVGEYFKRTVFLDDCRSWYRNGERITGLWPGSTLHALEAWRAPRWEDFDYETINRVDNSLRWLGNGWSTTQIDGDAAWYLDPTIIDIPSRDKIGRPFSH